MERAKLQTMEEKVATILAEVLRMPAAAITDELAMDDTDRWDSLTHMDLVMSLERSFDLQLSFEEILVMRSMRQIIRVLQDRGL